MASRIVSAASHATEHYQRVPKVYHGAWFYNKDSPYELWQLSLIRNVFERNMTPSCKIVDIGGGTGRFAHLLHGSMKLEKNILCVDLSADMLEQAKGLKGVDVLESDAVKFAEGIKDFTFDRVLLKEVIHHVSEDDLDMFFQNVFRMLNNDGICLIITRPKETIEYPFFKNAREVWRLGQPDASIFKNSMERAGFKAVNISEVNFPVRIPKKHWLEMLSDRFWSTFSTDNFSDDELKNGIKEVDLRYPEDENGNLSFSEKMIFIEGVAKKHTQKE